MRGLILLFLSALLIQVDANDVLSLDSRTFDSVTSGKTVFIKYVSSNFYGMCE